MTMRSARGFTLVETLVSMAIAIVVFGATLSVLDVFQRENNFDNLRNEEQDSARTTIDSLAREIRKGAAPSSTTPGALEKASRYAIVFQTIEPTTKALPEGDKNVTNAIRVRYCLNDEHPENEILWKQTAKWTSEKAPALPVVTACPDSNPEDYQTAVQVVQNIVNRQGGAGTLTEPWRWLFRYLPEGWTTVGQITAVVPNIWLNVTPHQRPGETEITSSIDLRNENRPPTASFTATQVGKVVVLNGSQSIDPDGLALTYKWWDNGVALPSTSEETTTKEEPKGIHTFKLLVTTPSGLTSELEQTMEVK